MNKPFLIHMLVQLVSQECAIPITNNLLRYRLSSSRPWFFQEAFPSMQQAEIILYVHISCLEFHLQLMGIASHDLLKFLVREPSLLEVVVRRE